MDKAGGVKKLDNKRNEVADKKRPENGLPPDPNKPHDDDIE